jgi:hypothetical protein
LNGPAGIDGSDGADSTVPGPPGPAGTTDWNALTNKPSTFAPDPEAVDDRVSALLTPGSNITLSYNDTANTLTINSLGGAGVTDGDKGDIVVSVPAQRGYSILG